MTNYEDLPSILLDNGFKELKNRYEKSSVKKAFRYGYNYEILIDPPRIRLMKRSQRKCEWNQPLNLHEVIGIFVYLQLNEKQKEKIKPENIASRYDDIMIRIAMDPGYEKGLEPIEKKIVEMFESFDLK